MVWQIDGYGGAGPLRFGMSPPKVEGIMGTHPVIKRSPPNAARYLFGPDRPVVIFEQNSLVEISFSPDASEPVKYGSEDLFLSSEKDVLEMLWAHSGRADTFEVAGFIVFLPLGITLTGFHDHDADQKAISCFVRGRRDRFGTRMKPIEFSS